MLTSDFNIDTMLYERSQSVILTLDFNVHMALQ